MRQLIFNACILKPSSTEKRHNLIPFAGIPLSTTTTLNPILVDFVQKLRRLCALRARGENTTSDRQNVTEYQRINHAELQQSAHFAINVQIKHEVPRRRSS